MLASAVRVIGWVDDPDTYPIQPKPHTMEYLHEVAHLRARTNVIGAATRVRHSLAQTIHRFFNENGYFWVNTAIITRRMRRGWGVVPGLDSGPRQFAAHTKGKVYFAQDLFRPEVFRTVSGQLNTEAYSPALTNVLHLRPTFRAAIRTPAATSPGSG